MLSTCASRAAVWLLSLVSCRCLYSLPASICPSSDLIPTWPTPHVPCPCVHTRRCAGAVGCQAGYPANATAPVQLCFHPSCRTQLNLHTALVFACTGVLVLLAAKLGILQMPQLPQLPKVPGLARQLNKAGDAFRDRFDDLDDGFDDARGSAAAAAAATRQNKYSAAAGSSRLLTSSSSSSSSINDGGGGDAERVTSRLREAQSQQAAMTSAQSQALPQSAPPLATPQQQEQQQQQQQRLAPAAEAAGPGVAAFKGLAQQLGSTAKSLTTKALEGGKAASGVVLQQGRQALQQGRESEAVQGLSQQTADAASKAAKATKQLASGLWQRGQQLASPGGLQGLKQDAAAAVGRASEAVKVVKQGNKIRPQEQEQQPQQRQQQQQGQLEPAAAAGAGAVTVGRSEQEVDAILANS